MVIASGVVARMLFASEFVFRVYVRAKVSAIMKGLVVILTLNAVIALSNSGAAMIFQSLETLFHALTVFSLEIQH